MPTIQQLALYLRVDNFIGSANPLTDADLAKHFGFSVGGVQVEMRNVISDAIANGELIGNHSRGFYLIGTLTELEQNLDSLQSGAEKILFHNRNMMSSWNNQIQTNQSSRTDLFVSL